MKYRVISGSVIVIGPPSAICFLKSGITLPRLPMTLPKRTAQATREYTWLCTSNSVTRLQHPMTLEGFTALSDEMQTTRWAVLARPRRTFCVPMMLLSTASSGFNSISGTCLSAAA